MAAAEAIVLDNGSGSCKAGFAGDLAPRVAVPTVLAWPRGPGLQAGAPRERRNGFSLADEVEAAAAASSSGVAMRRPIEHGVVTSWEGLEKIWRRTFAELQASDGGHPVLVTEPPLSAKAHREQMVQLLFEDFGAPAMHVAVSGALSMYATGSRTGLVVEVGDGVAQMVPIFEEFVVSHAVQRLDIGGRDLTDYLMRLLYEERGYSFTSAASRRAAVAMKEQHCYVAPHYIAELDSAASNPGLERTYQLPDGSAVIAAGSERFRCPEALFAPSLLGKEAPGIQELALQAILRCELDVQRGLAGNVTLSGGTMLLEGVHERMLRELSAVLPPSLQPKVTSPTSPKDAAFLGGSILASVADMQRNWFTRAQYEEHGASAIHARSLCLTEGGARRKASLGGA